MSALFPCCVLEVWPVSYSSRLFNQAASLVFGLLSLQDNSSSMITATQGAWGIMLPFFVYPPCTDNPQGSSTGTIHRNNPLGTLHGAGFHGRAPGGARTPRRLDAEATPPPTQRLFGFWIPLAQSWVSTKAKDRCTVLDVSVVVQVWTEVQGPP